MQLLECTKILTLLKWFPFSIKYLYSIWKRPYRFSKVQDCVLYFDFEVSFCLSNVAIVTGTSNFVYNI